MKMNAGRGRDIGDLTTMLGWASKTQLDNVRQIFQKYQPEDSQDLESIIYIGQQERKTQHG